MEVRIQTITPLWTGGVDGSMDRIHETGIIGSMRWWYEAIVRGLGGKACDPSSHECNFEAERYRKSTALNERQRLQDAGLCDICQVFGATGWRRRFWLEVIEDQTKPIWIPEDRLLNIRPPDRTRGWFLPPGRMGELAVRFTSDKQILSHIAALFLFMEKWGNLGAKPQLGYGVFEILNGEEVRALAATHQWQAMGTIPVDHRRPKPDLRCFGFFRYNFQPDKSIWWTWVPGMERVAAKVQPFVTAQKTMPLYPAMKNEWRFHHRWEEDREEEKQMFGTTQGRKWDETQKKHIIVRERSKISLSWAYKKEKEWEARGWAWLQKDSQIAKKLWDLVQKESGWQEIIKAEGNLKAYPSGPWSERSVVGVTQFLEDSR
jgi:CRISPR-associated protein Cmr1